MRNIDAQDHGLELALDNELIAAAKPAIERGEKVVYEGSISNVNRTVGTMLSHEITKKYGLDGLPDGTFTAKLAGSAGQSLGCWTCKGVTIEVTGDANDYVGKGLSGGEIVVRPPAAATFKAEDSIIIGNVALTARRRVRRFSAASPPSVSACEIRARRPWWRAWATTDAST